MKQMKQIEGLLAEAETVKAILITSNLRLVVSIAKKFNEPSHSFDELIPVLQQKTSMKPKAFVVHTIKGKGIKAFENDPSWHARKIKGAELEIGKKELGIE
jgi:deoxyxylulose-5-phosphate synthase